MQHTIDCNTVKLLDEGVLYVSPPGLISIFETLLIEFTCVELYKVYIRTYVRTPVYITYKCTYVRKTSTHVLAFIVSNIQLSIMFRM